AVERITGRSLDCDSAHLGWPGLESSEAPDCYEPGLPKTPAPATHMFVFLVIREVAWNPSRKKEFLRNDGFLPRPWRAKVGTNRCINHGSTSHEARTVQWPAVSGAGAAGRARRHLGREPGMGGRGTQGGEQAGRVPGRHVRVSADPRLAVRSRKEAGGA